MTTIILEDEAPAARRLTKILTDLVPDLRILAQPDTVPGAVDALTQNQPDLIFADIQLADGLSFDAFRQVPPSCPVIFTTAYDEYAIRAFSVNSIDYLLKPIDPDKLAQSLAKFRLLHHPPADHFQALMADLLHRHLPQKPAYRSRFLVSFRDAFGSIPAADVAYFYSEQRLTHLVTQGGKTYPVSQTMDELETQLDPHHFFRVNRQFLVAARAIGGIYAHFSGKLKLTLTPQTAADVLVSREKAGPLKEWLNR